MKRIVVMFSVILFGLIFCSASFKNKNLEKSVNSTVFILSSQDTCSSGGITIHGSGVTITPDGYIMTCYHVIKSAVKLQVIRKKDTLPARIVGTLPDFDIAILHVNKKMPVPDINWKHNFCLGEKVYTLGYPLHLNLTLSEGIVSGEYKFSDDTAKNMTYIQTDAVVNPGNSGGVLLDENFKVVGINAMIVTYTDFFMGYSFSIPLSCVRDKVNSIVLIDREKHKNR